MKYRLVKGRKLEINGVVCYQIRAMRNIPRHGIKRGDYGGFVQDYRNLSQDDDCWVDERAVVMDKAYVSGNALVYGDCLVCDHAKIRSNAKVGGNTEVRGWAKLFGNAVVRGTVCRYKDMMSCGSLIEAWRDSAIEPPYHHIIVKDHAVLRDKCIVTGNSIVGGNAIIGNKTTLYGYVTVNKTKKYEDGTLTHTALAFNPYGTTVSNRSIIAAPISKRRNKQQTEKATVTAIITAV